MKRFLCFFFCLFAFTSLVGRAEEKNSIIACENSLDMFGWDLAFIRHAKHSIDMAPCFFGGKIARELLTEIEARLEVCPDLQVNILATPILFEKKDYEIIDGLKRTYPDNFRIEYATNLLIVWPDVTGVDNHVKVCIVDEQYFSMGGTNLETTHCADGTYTPAKDWEKMNVFAKNLPAGTRDQDIVGRGPIAKQMRKTFCQLFALWSHYNKAQYFEKDPQLFNDNPFYFEVAEKPFIESFELSDKAIPLEDDQISYILSGPHQKKNAITTEYARLIQGAKKEIKIANLYLNPADEVFQALLDAVNRGVKLTVISNGITDISPEFTKYFGWANRLTYVPLFYGEKTFNFWEYQSVRGKKPNKTQIYEYHVEDVLIHKKVMIVDDTVAVIGSYNLGMKSHLSDYETIMVIHSPEVVKEFNKVYVIDLAHSREVTHAEAVDWYFDPVISYIGTFQKRFGGLL